MSCHVLLPHTLACTTNCLSYNTPSSNRSTGTILFQACSSMYQYPMMLHIFIMSMGPCTCQSASWYIRTHTRKQQREVSTRNVDSAYYSACTLRYIPRSIHHSTRLQQKHSSSIATGARRDCCRYLSGCHSSRGSVSPGRGHPNQRLQRTPIRRGIMLLRYWYVGVHTLLFK